MARIRVALRRLTKRPWSQGPLNPRELASRVIGPGTCLLFSFGGGFKARRDTEPNPQNLNSPDAPDDPVGRCDQQSGNISDQGEEDVRSGFGTEHLDDRLRLFRRLSTYRWQHIDRWLSVLVTKVGG